MHGREFAELEKTNRPEQKGTGENEGWQVLSQVVMDTGKSTSTQEMLDRIERTVGEPKPHTYKEKEG